jgi:hypothetical protein
MLAGAGVGGARPGRVAEVHSDGVRNRTYLRPSDGAKVKESGWVFAIQKAFHENLGLGG